MALFDVPDSSIGQQLLDVPFSDMIRSMGLAIAQAQFELDQTATRLAQMMSGKYQVEVPDDMAPSGVRIEERESYVHFDGEDLSLLELGFTPTFYQFVDTIIEVKISITMTASRHTRIRDSNTRRCASKRSSPVDCRSNAIGTMRRRECSAMAPDHASCARQPLRRRRVPVAACFRHGIIQQPVANPVRRLSCHATQQGIEPLHIAAEGKEVQSVRATVTPGNGSAPDLLCDTIPRDVGAGNMCIRGHTFCIELHRILLGASDHPLLVSNRQRRESIQPVTPSLAHDKRSTGSGTA